MPSVEVVIVTHDDPEGLVKCLESLLRNASAICSIRIIDTAGSRVAAEAVGQGDPRIVVERLEQNVGPAGGWAAGLSSFLTGNCDFVWLFDDDCIVLKDALKSSMEALAHADVVQSRMIPSGSDRTVSTQGWCGVLLRREVVEAVGVPNADLVWWTEDTEYLQWRIPRAGFRVVRAPNSVVEVALRPVRAPKPAWKYYYEARNQVAYRLRTQRPAKSDRAVPRHLTRSVRWWRATRSVSKLLGRALIIERHHRLSKAFMVGRGTYHGLVGRSGLVVELGQSDRARLVGASNG